jgi:hypothetical protein
MSNIIKKRRIHCSRRHVSAHITEFGDGTFAVRCGLSKYCGEECPYLKDPNYQSTFQRAPEYKPR